MVASFSFNRASNERHRSSNELSDKFINISTILETHILVMSKLFLKKNAENVLRLETFVYLCNQNYT